MESDGIVKLRFLAVVLIVIIGLISASNVDMSSRVTDSNNYPISGYDITTQKEGIPYFGNSNSLTDGTSIMPAGKIFIVANNTPYSRIYQVCVHELCHVDNWANVTDAEPICVYQDQTRKRVECDMLIQQIRINQIKGWLFPN